jgi:poly-beta-1,6-N-acetyl-D-glucosamine synthase
MVTEIILFIALILSIAYAAFLERWAASWSRIIERIGSTASNDDVRISVVVPFRNEEGTIAGCIEALKAQKDCHSNVEFILVDDNSDDSSSDLVQKFIEGDSRFCLLKSNGSGKKDAIRNAIGQAKYEFIATLDADCIVSDQWISQIRKELKYNECDFLILPVLVRRLKFFFGDVAYTEWLSLASVTGGSAISGSALMCNGANLVFRKKLYQIYDRPNEHSVSSGDDVFLMIEAKKVGKVSYGAHKNLIAVTDLPFSFKDFIDQRIRWAGKTKKMNDRFIIMFGGLIVLLQFSLLVLLSLSLVGSGNWLYFFGLVTIKLIFEFRLLSAMSRVFNIPWSFTSFMVMSLLHPFYAIFVALFSLVYKPKWKGRKIRV